MGRGPGGGRASPGYQAALVFLVFLGVLDVKLLPRLRKRLLEQLQVDELWTYVQKKQARLSFEERLRLDVGDQYAFVAIDAETKLIPHFDVGKRNMVTAYRFMDVLKAWLDAAFRFQLTTDGFVPYIGAVEHAWGADAPDFGQLVKLYGASLPGPARYSPPKILEAVPTVIHGTPDPALISTSFIERQNPHGQNGVPPLHAVDERLQQEAGEPEGRSCGSLRVV